MLYFFWIAWSRRTMVELSQASRMHSCCRPENVGIIGMEIYFPPTFVSQEQLGKLYSPVIIVHLVELCRNF